MLDKVVDVHGSMSRYFYVHETGHYGAAADPENRVAYHRATECTPASLPTNAHANSMRCYPVR
jgi:hypothetical protein